MAQQIFGAGIIGAGVISQDHARAYTQLAPRVRLVGLAEIDQNRARRLAADFFIPVVTDDYQQLLAREDIDLISVCTPPSLHEQIVIDALEAGKFVLCEKPLAHTLAAADRIIEVARRYPNRLNVVYQNRYSPDVLRTQWLIDEGHFGELQFGCFARIGGLPLEHRTGKSWWGRWDVAGGGALITQCIHELDIALLLFGPVTRVTAFTATLSNPIQSEDTISATLEHQSGALVTITCALGHSVEVRVQSIVMGRDMAAQFPLALNSMDHGKRNKLQRELAKRFPSGQRPSLLPGKLNKVWRLAKRKVGIRPPKPPSPHKPCVAAMLDAMEANVAMPISAEEARKSLELCVAIYTAAITHDLVELPLPRDTPFYNGVTVDDYNGGAATAHVAEVQA